VMTTRTMNTTKATLEGTKGGRTGF
jgi:hypothetical protein